MKMEVQPKAYNAPGCKPRILRDPHVTTKLDKLRGELRRLISIVEFFLLDANPDRTTSTSAWAATRPPFISKPDFRQYFMVFLVVIDYNVKASCFAIPCKAPAVEVEMMFSTAGAVFGAAPRRMPASHGMVVKQEPDEQAGFQGTAMHPMVGVQTVPPLPMRTIYNYREVTGRGNAAVFQPILPAPAVKVEPSLQSPERRLCAAMNCTVILPMEYPHLRCRTCRARNVPRRPELSTVLTPAQLLARDRKYQAAPPLPSRAVPGPAGPVGRVPPPLPFRRPPPPPLPSRVQRPLPQVQTSGAQRAVPPAGPSPLCPTLPPAACKVDPDIDADIALQALLKPSSDDDGEADVIDLEYLEEDLSYPDSGNATPTDVKPPPLPSRRTANPSLPSAVVQPANKRRKVSYAFDLPPETNGDAASNTHPASISSAAPPLPSRPKAVPTATAPPLPTRRPLHPPPNAAASSSESRTCSEPECQNALPTTSPGTRCMSCISKAWKRRHSQSVAETRPQLDGKKKAVSWADKNEEHDEFNFRETLRKHTTSTSGSPPSDLSDNGERNVEGWDSELTELPQSDSEGGSDNGEEGEDDSENELTEPEEPQVPPNPKRTGLKIRIPPRSRSKSDGSSSSSTEPRPLSPPSGTSLLSTSPVEEDPSNPPPVTSSPTPVEEDDDVSSTGQTTPTTTPDIEPESEVDNSSGMRTCSGPRCNQILPVGYHWKSCVVCRASARGYQRKRQNLQGRHIQLDLELEEHLKEVGAVPRASRPSPVKVDIEPFDDDVPGHTLITGARVCSARDCSFVVPSVEEYPWKLCNRCRTRSKDSHKSRSRRGSSKKQAPKEYRHEIVGPDAFAMKREDERCLSFDCGMLVSPQSKYPYCRQCRLQDWRLKRRNLRQQVILEAERAERAERATTPSPSLSAPLSIKIPALRNRLKVERPLVPPRPPTPYPEYKNLAGLLANLRKLAKNFFDAQTMHFAHQPPGSTPSLSIFIFDGEFTLVAPDLLVAQKRKAQVESTVASIQREVGSSAMVQYSEKKWLTMFNNGIVTRFVCWRQPVRVRVPIPVPIPVPVTGSKAEKGPNAGKECGEQGKEDGEGQGKAKGSALGSETKAKHEAKEEALEDANQGEPQKFLLKEVLSYHRVMEGELEIAVFADKSHPFIPGERTVVRLRLVG